MSSKELVKEILAAQGLSDIIPTSESITILDDAMQKEWAEGYKDAEHDYDIRA